MWVSQESSSGQARFALVEGCNERVGPGNRMEALDFRAGEDVVKGSLDGGSVWRETPIKIQHSQETSELTDALWRGTSLEISDTFREGLGAHG